MDRRSIGIRAGWCAGALGCAAADRPYRCKGGICAWCCASDAGCRDGFGVDGRGCRRPGHEPGPTCLLGDATREGCLAGAPADALVVCR